MRKKKRPLADQLTHVLILVSAQKKIVIVPSSIPKSISKTGGVELRQNFAESKIVYQR